MAANPNTAASLETSEASNDRITIGGLSLKVFTPLPEEEEYVNSMMNKWYPSVEKESVATHAINSWTSVSSKYDPEKNFTNVTVNVTRVTLTNGKKRFIINISYSTVVDGKKVSNCQIPVPATHPFKSAKNLDWLECYCHGSTIGENSVTKIIVEQLLMSDKELSQELSIPSRLGPVLDRYSTKSDEDLEKLGRFAACEYLRALITTKSYLINVGRRKPYTLSSYRAYLLNVLSYWE